MFVLLALAEIVRGVAALPEVDCQTANMQRGRRELGIDPVARAVSSPDFVTAVIHLDPADRPAIAVELLTQRLARLPVGHRVDTIVVSQQVAAGKQTCQGGADKKSDVHNGSPVGADLEYPSATG